MSPKRRSVIATVALVLCVVALLERRELFARHPVGIALQVAAAALMLWARLTFGTRSFHAAANPTAGGLVTTGPYRFWRHPIYAAILLFLWAGVLSQRHAPTPVARLIGFDLVEGGDGRAVWRAELRAEGTVVQRGRTVGLVECTVTDADGRLVARATSTCLTLRGEQAAGR